jgi:nucleoside-diphosphate-sugar epimerase
MENIFIFGGSGFVGKNLSRFLSQYYQVFVVDRKIDESFFKEYPKIVTIEKSVLDGDGLDYSKVAPHFVINLISIVTAERNLDLFSELIETNLQVLLNLFESLKDVTELKLFIQFGSSEEYGLSTSPFTEDIREIPNSPYGLVKQLVSNTTIMLNRNYNFPALVVRPGNLFGQFQESTKFIPYIIQELVKGDTLNVTECIHKRDFIAINDFSFSIQSILQNYKGAIGEILNISSGNSEKLKDIIEFCKAKINSSSTINYGALPYRENEIMDLRCDISKLEGIIGRKLNFDIYERLNELIKNYLD